MKKLLLPLCLSILGCNNDQSAEQDNNHPPVLDSVNREELSLVKVLTGRTTTISVLASDKDDDLLTYFLLDNPDWVSIDNNVLTIKPLSENLGTYQFKIIISDGTASTAVNVSLTVQ
ncbi:TPA: hypothetical protein RQK90_004801, partial [Vibrio vulnificus]|nr:hypothetical protein [Vibrio vulnificus]